MTISFRYDKENNVRVQVVTGSLVMEEFIAEIRKIYASEDIPVRANVIWDISGADVSKVIQDDVRQLVSFVKQAWQEDTEHKAAFIVGSDLSFGMVRMYEQLQNVFDEDNVRIFKSSEDVWAWMLD